MSTHTEEMPTASFQEHLMVREGILLKGYSDRRNYYDEQTLTTVGEGDS